MASVKSLRSDGGIELKSTRVRTFSDVHVSQSPHRFDLDVGADNARHARVPTARRLCRCISSYVDVEGVG